MLVIIKGLSSYIFLGVFYSNLFFVLCVFLKSEGTRPLVQREHLGHQRRVRLLILLQADRVPLGASPQSLASFPSAN